MKFSGEIRIITQSTFYVNSPANVRDGVKSHKSSQTMIDIMILNHYCHHRHHHSHCHHQNHSHHHHHHHHHNHQNPSHQNPSHHHHHYNLHHGHHHRHYHHSVLWASRGSRGSDVSIFLGQMAQKATVKDCGVVYGLLGVLGTHM